MHAVHSFIPEVDKSHRDCANLVADCSPTSTAASSTTPVPRIQTAQSPCTANAKQACLVRLMELTLLPSAGRHLIAADCALRRLHTYGLGARGDAVERVRFSQNT